MMVLMMFLILMIMMMMIFMIILMMMMKRLILIYGISCLANGFGSGVWIRDMSLRGMGSSGNPKA